MSMELMVKAMKAKVGNPLRKLTLIKLADNANDKGECWPSYQHIADQCEISRRSAMRHISDLEKAGFLTKIERKGGVKGSKSHLYKLHISEGVTESHHLPEVVTESHRGSDRESPAGGDRESPRTSHSSEPVIEPKDIAPHGECAPDPVIVDQHPAEPKPAPKKPAAKKTELDYSSWPTLPSEQVLADWLELRKKLRAPVTQTVITRLASELTKATQAGFSVDDCLGLACERGWRGLKSEWVINANNQNSGVHHAISRPATQQQQRAEVDAAINNWQDTSWADDLIRGDDSGFI